MKGPGDAVTVQPLLRMVLQLALVLALLFAANRVAGEVAAVLEMKIWPGDDDAMQRSIVTSAILYTLLLAIPFVPGAEVGLAMLAMLGPPIVMLVYGCTVAALTLSFAIGRVLPFAVLTRIAWAVRLRRLARLLGEIEPLDQEARLAYLTAQAPYRFVPFLMRYRYLALGALLNLPGNVIIGGGGGIALLAGVSRLYSVPAALLTFAVAVAPVPLLVFFFGKDVLGG